MTEIVSFCRVFIRPGMNTLGHFFEVIAVPVKVELDPSSIGFSFEAKPGAFIKSSVIQQINMFSTIKRSDDIDLQEEVDAEEEEKFNMELGSLSSVTSSSSNTRSDS
jgi:hypothetical protein